MELKQSDSSNYITVDDVSTISLPEYICEKHGEIKQHAISVNMPDQGVNDENYCLLCWLDMIRKNCCKVEVKGDE